jgi:hypothetical protein
MSNAYGSVFERTRSIALGPIPFGRVPTLALHASACEHASEQTSNAVLRSNVPQLRSNALAEPPTYACMRLNVLLALERTSAVSTNRPEAAKF